MSDKARAAERPLLASGDAAFDAVAREPASAGSALTRLLEARARERLPHALLVAGPTGSGKRWLAVRLAQALACEEEASPCLECADCRRVEDGLDTELHLLEPAFDRKRRVLRTEISVGQVRELQERLTFRSAGRRRFVLVDPADRLSTVAQEALLKTLEEPPPGVTLALLTARPSFLKPTVLSRCQLVRVASPSRASIVEHLRGREGVGEERARLVAALCGGDLRRAQVLEPDEAADEWLELARALYEVLGARGESRARDLALDFAPRKGDERGGASEGPVVPFLGLLERILRDVMRVGELDGPAGPGDDELSAELTHPGGLKAARALASRLPPPRAARALEEVGRARDDLALHLGPKVLLTGLLMQLHALRRAEEAGSA